MPDNLYHITTRSPHTSDICMECERANRTIYVFLLGIFQLRLCHDCLAQLGREIGEVLGDAQTTERLQRGLRVLHDCLDGIACDCLDPPQDREESDERGTDATDPSAHAQYCPIYLSAYIAALTEGMPLPE